jgi:hypothetical protein
MRIAFDPILAACSAALFSHYRTWPLPMSSLNAQAAIRWPDAARPSPASNFIDRALLSLRPSRILTGSKTVVPDA